MKTQHTFAIVFLCAITAGIAPGARAASLKRAEFTRVINDVRTLSPQQQPAPAKIGDTVTGQTAVSTGVASRAELQFSDKTLTRIGSNSVFKLDQADRTVNLEKGVILLQVPKQIGGAKVRTAAVTAAVTGTTLIFERIAGAFSEALNRVVDIFKIIVLEGEVDVFLNSKPGNVRTLVAGDILMFKDDGTELPLAAKVDLDLLKKTSKLLDQDEFGPLGNQKHLADALDEQDKLKKDGELLKTAFEIIGRGTQVTLTNEARQEIFKTLVLQNRDTGNGGGNNGAPPDGGNNPNGPGTPSGDNDGEGNGPAPRPHGAGTPGPAPATPILNHGTTVFDTGSTIVTNPHVIAFNSILGPMAEMQGTIYNPATDGFFNTYMYGDAQTFPEADGFLFNHGSWFVFKGEELYLASDIGVNTAPGPRNILLGAIGNVFLSESEANRAFPAVTTDSSWTIPTSVDALFISSQHGSITMDSSFALYGSAIPQDVAFYAYGPTSDVDISGAIESSGGIYLPYGSFKAHAGRDIVTNDARIEAGEIKLNARRDVKIDNSSSIAAKTLLQVEALGNIHIQNSSQLAALSEVDPLSILLKAINGNVEITNSFMDAANVEMVSANGSIRIEGDLPGYSTIAADVIKARVLPTGGELLVSNSILGRDTPSAGSLIKLYGEGVSGVRFSGDNTLNATNVDIAGRTVTIDADGIVRLSHPTGTRVFTDTANFNNGGVNGNFTDKGGAPVSVTRDIYDHRTGY